jgi:hypothetical protein
VKPHRTRLKSKWFYAAIVIYGLLHVNLWLWQFRIIQRSPTSAIYIGNAIQSVAFWIIILAVLSLKKFRPVLTGLSLLFVFSLLLQFFSYIYWSYGTTTNFNTPLTHLDSLYFALGTLTTAGTGNIVAISETARRLQTLQMVLDLGLVLFAVSLVVARYFAHFVDGRVTTSEKA